MTFLASGYPTRRQQKRGEVCCTVLDEDVEPSTSLLEREMVAGNAVH
jgi:hypothetical protein